MSENAHMNNASAMERIVNILFNRDDLIKMKKIDNINVKR